MDDAARINYLIQLQNLLPLIEQARQVVRARVNAWEAAALAAKWTVFQIITQVLSPVQAWDQAMANLADVTIPLEIMRLQQNPSAPIGNIAAFQPPAPPALPVITAGQNGDIVSPPPSTNQPPSTQPPTTQLPSTTTGTVFGIPVKTFAIGAGVGLVVLLLLSGSPTRRG